MLETYMKGKPLIVLKLGTACITLENGDLNQVVLLDIVRQIAELHQDYRIVLVSSGAVGTGKNYLNQYQGSIIERKAAAAIGNPLLLNKYAQFFEPYQIAIAQSLCERQHFTHQGQFHQLQETFGELWKNDIIPIANENDVVSNLELKFSDNDELATLLAVGFGASLLLIGTSTGGLKDREDNIVKHVVKIDQSILDLVRDEQSSLGIGGMATKLTFARLATKLGVKTILFDPADNGIIRAMNDEIGTVCLAQSSNEQERMQWLTSGNLVTGKLQVTSTANQELLNSEQLRINGIEKVLANFEKGEVFEILDPEGKSVAMAKARISSKEILENIKDHSFVLASTADIIIL